MEDEINRLRELLAQLPLDQQERLLPQLIEFVEWFRIGDESTGSFTRSISFGISKTTSVRRVS